MPLAKKNLDSLGWSKKKKFRVDRRDYFDRFSDMTSLSDVVKTFDTMDALELWQDEEGNYYWATCATLNEKEIREKKRVVLTFNQIMLIPDVKAEFNAWKKKKSDDPPKKLCGFRTPKCVLESLEKDKKPRAPATPKKDVDESKEVSKGKKKSAADVRPAAVLTKQSAAALAGVDIDDSNFDIGKKLEFQPVSAPSCTSLEPTKEYSAHFQILHLMSIFEDHENQNDNLVERIKTWVTNYRQSEVGTTKMTLTRWAKYSDPDFKNLLAGFGTSVLSTYKNKVVNPFVNSVNEKLKEYVTLYEELQAKIKSNQIFVNQYKADRERLSDDLQSMLAKNRALEAELEEKKSEVTSLYQLLEDPLKNEEKMRKEETDAVVNDHAQTVITSSGGFRKRNEPSPDKKKKKKSSSSSSSSSRADDSDMELTEVKSGKRSEKPYCSSSSAVILVDSDEEDLFTKPAIKKNKATDVVNDSDNEDDLFSKPATSAGKKRSFDDEEEEEETKPMPKKTAVPSKPKTKAAVVLDDDDDFFNSSDTSSTNVNKIVKSMDLDSDDEEESKPVAKHIGKSKPNTMKILLPNDEDD